MATEVVGEITALMAMPKPRPRRMTPVPRLSNGFDQSMRSSTLSITFSTGASFRIWPVACWPPSRMRFLRRNSTGSIFSARAIMSVWLSYAQTSCGTPKPRSAPAGVTLV